MKIYPTHCAIAILSLALIILAVAPYPDEASRSPRTELSTSN